MIKIQREVSTVLHRKNDNQKAIIGSSKSVLVQYSHDSYHSIFTPVYEGRIPLTYFDDPQHVQMILHGHLNGIECIEVSTMVWYIEAKLLHLYSLSDIRWSVNWKRTSKLQELWTGMIEMNRLFYRTHHHRLSYAVSRTRCFNDRLSVFSRFSYIPIPLLYRFFLWLVYFSVCVYACLPAMWRICVRGVNWLVYLFKRVQHVSLLRSGTIQADQTFTDSIPARSGTSPSGAGIT